ncbi:CBS domain-containing protein [Candidatus Woesearchaeota archaeon]|nr:CBS domain-containing protein [Candidatus Woesearchaeota archaeon]
MKTGYAVADVMTTKPLTAPPQTSIKNCAELMRKHDVSSMLITEEEDLVGIVTGKDYVYKAAAKGLSVEEPVSRIMSAPTHTVRPGADIFDAVKSMNENGVRHLPVMEGRKMVGYITMTTILKIEPQLFELLTEKIELRGISPQSSLRESLDSELSGQCESCGNYSSKLVESEGRMVCPNCVIR